MLFKQLQNAVITPESVEYMVSKLVNSQRKQHSVVERTSREWELRQEIIRLVAAIANRDESDALVNALGERERELRELAAATKGKHEFSGDEIRTFVEGAIRDIPQLLAKSPQLAKAKLAQHVDSIRLLPQPDGTYVAEGEWDLLGNRGPVMVAGACNASNLLLTGFRLEIVRPAA
jgi:Glu-tRNA(Gln) amidotransferase subunit E-like FAD-binding protein